MTSLDVPEHPLLEPLTASFSDLIERGQVELAPGPGPDEIELQADEWTLHLEGWPIRLAFIALDDDPATESEQAQALTAALGPQDLAALRDVDARFEGELIAALCGSRDPLSVVLGAMLREDKRG